MFSRDIHKISLYFLALKKRQNVYSLSPKSIINRQIVIRVTILQSHFYALVFLREIDETSWVV